MLSPKRQKYRKSFRGKIKGFSYRGTSLVFGEFGLKAIEHGLVSSAQIEAARKAITHYTRREGKLWMRIFPYRPITAKAAGVGMGAGKGDVKGYAAVVHPGKILFELSGVSEGVAQQAFGRASDKLPMGTKFLKK